MIPAMVTVSPSAKLLLQQSQAPTFMVLVSYSHKQQILETSKILNKNEVRGNL